MALSRLRALALRLRTDRKGATLVEFALISPVLISVLLGAMDLSRAVYLRSVLEGELQNAARRATMQAGQSGAGQAATDKIVTDRMKQISKTTTLKFTRMAYLSYKKAEARKEDFTDLNGNGKCDAGEPFEDVNGNSSWDMDAGSSGQGNAKDAVIYTVTATIPHVFPVYGIFGWDPDMKVESSTILRNQPYSGSTKPVAATCS
ncbi:MAG: pilus assembly protein [Sphingomonadales bacterium]|nr:pilus assembly protein [Sphingomonadales bacterium]